MGIVKGERQLAVISLVCLLIALAVSLFVSTQNGFVFFVSLLYGPSLLLLLMSLIFAIASYRTRKNKLAGGIIIVMCVIAVILGLVLWALTQVSWI